MLILQYKQATIRLNQKTKEIQVQIKKPDLITEGLVKKIEELKLKYKKYSISLIIDEKQKVDNLEVNELYKLSKHVGQNIKLVVYIINYEEKKLRTGKTLINVTMEIPGKKKFVKGKMFNEGVFTLEKNQYYYISGKVTKEDARYIKKNELSLGKKEDYSIMINSLQKHDHEAKVIENKYSEARQELHAHTMYSKKDGFITTKDISKAFVENKVDQIAITDHGAVFAFIPYVNELKKEFKDKNKRLLLGCEFYAVDTDKHDIDTTKKIEEIEMAIENLESSTELEEQLEYLNEILISKREERDENKKLSSRKSLSEEERVIAKDKYEVSVMEISDTTTAIKNCKEAIKNKIDEIAKKKNELTLTTAMLNKTHDIERDHLTVMIKTKDEVMDYRGEKLSFNPGVLELYKLITKSYKDYFSTPTTKEMKMYGKRPTIPYHELFKEGTREKFIINSACAFGKHMKLAVEGKWNEFKVWVKNLDAVELQPIHNNIYMLKHKDYPNIQSLDDLKALHQDIYKYSKEAGVPVIFTSDAHINDKEDRDIRSVYKSGYISGILSQVAESIAKKRAKGIEVEEERQSDEDDFAVETQPYILSREEAVNDLKEQGFTDEQIQEIMDNTKMIANSCSNAFEITLAPDKMFLGDFPGINVKEEIPRLALEALIKKYSKDGTKEGVDSKILERYDEEMEAVQSTGYEILYYIAYWSCRKSEEMGYFVGSRGSAGSMFLTFLLKIGTNNPLLPHYFCPSCKKVEWVETELVGLDLPTKVCECGTEMENDGCNIESHNFLGWKNAKIPDIDLNFSSVVQTEVHKAMIEVFGEENMIKSGTQTFYQENALKSKIFKHIPRIDEKIQNEEFDIDYYAHNINTMDTTGAHPGGLLLKPNDIPFELITPLVYISDDPKKAELSSFVDYHNLEQFVPKVDALGHSDPTMLKELKDFTGIDYDKIKLNDPKMYEAILNPELIGIKREDYPFPSTTMAISEMNSDFTMGVLAEIKPKNMTDMIYFSGVTHGSGVWQGNVAREKVVSGEIKLQDMFPVRDIIFQHLVNKFNWDPKDAFDISESVRKGKGIKKWENELRAKLPKWMVDSMAQIGYMFPKSHALSYVTAAMKIYWYKINEPDAFYSAALNRYGVEDNNNSNLDFIEIYDKLNTKDDLMKLLRYYDMVSDNPAKIKSNKRLASILYEAKLRGIKINKADFSSLANTFSPSHHEKGVILSPLTSMKGVGGSAANSVSEAYSIYGDSLLNMTRKELEDLRITINGKDSKAFNKKVLDAFFGE